MTIRSANDLLDRLQEDHDFAVEVHRLAADPTALEAYVADRGFDLAGDDLVDAMLERYGDKLTPDQLAAVAGGIAPVAIITMIVIGISALLSGGAVGVGVGYGAKEVTS